jgi:hypothetical protein
MFNCLAAENPSLVPHSLCMPSDFLTVVTLLSKDGNMSDNTRHLRVIWPHRPLVCTVASNVLQMRDTCHVKYKRTEDMLKGDGDKSRPQGKSYILPCLSDDQFDRRRVISAPVTQNSTMFVFALSKSATRHRRPSCARTLLMRLARDLRQVDMESWSLKGENIYYRQPK